MQQQVPWLAAERYEVGEVVGRGGYGMVCRGVDRKTGRAVALKMLSPEAGRDPDRVERMLREQQALVALEGTCAVTVVELCRLEGNAPCLVMEWLDGHDLEQQLGEWENAQRRGDNELLLSVLEPLTQTLDRAHEMGLVHRDIKPANVFLTPSSTPHVRLLDFGLSRMKSAAPLTAAGMVLGSPSYIAPETWSGNSAQLDGRADLFALGVIVFRWLTGQLPFDAPDLMAKMTAVTTGPRPSAVARRPELPASVDAWVKRALAVEPDERFQTGSELREALAAALRGDSWPAHSADTSGVREVEPLAKAPERKGKLAAAWGAAAGLFKRFTSPRDRAIEATLAPSEPPPQVATPSASTDAVDDAPNSDRKSIWLDSEVLEDAPPSIAPVTPHVAEDTGKTDTPLGKGKRKGKGKGKGKQQSKSKAKHKPKAKAKASKAKGKGKRGKKAR
ncbi:MAG TPA: protein kinase [Polyangiaceae bacterium]|nr:protein kinase [Polyangiaceae bacterium]